MLLKITKKGQKKFNNLDKYTKLSVTRVLLNIKDNFNDNGEDKITLKEVKETLLRDKFDEIFFWIKDNLNMDIQNDLIYPGVNMEKEAINIVEEFVDNIKDQIGLNSMIGQEHSLRSNMFSFEKNLRNYVDFYSEKEKNLEKTKTFFEDRISKIEKDIKIYQEDLQFFINKVDQNIDKVMSENMTKFIDFNYGKLDKVLVSFIISLYLDKFTESFYKEYNEYIGDLDIEDNFFNEVFYVREDSKLEEEMIDIEDLLFD